MSDLCELKRQIDYLLRCCSQPPKPLLVSDVIKYGRTNELISFDLIGSIPGIVSVNLIQANRYGTLNRTGLGTFNYRSSPRFLGQDTLIFILVNSQGVISNPATVFLNITDHVPYKPSPRFLFCNASNLDISFYEAGVVTKFFTATFPTFSNLPNGVNGLATNRDDNLIYYNANPGANPIDYGKVCAYDYVNNTTFLLFDSLTDPAFGYITPKPLFSGGANGSVYRKGALYMVTGSSNLYFRITLTPYNPLISPPQSVFEVAVFTLPYTVDYGDMAWDYTGERLIVSGLVTVGTTTTNMIGVMIPGQDNPDPPKTITIPGIGTPQVTAGPDLVTYFVYNGTSGVDSVNFQTGGQTGSYTPLSITDASDAAEWIIPVQ